MPKPEKVSIRYVQVSNLLFFSVTKQSKKAKLRLFSRSQVNLIFGCLMFIVQIILKISNLVLTFKQ